MINILAYRELEESCPECGGLTKIQRSSKARLEYKKGTRELWNSIKKNPKLSPLEGMEVSDELMISGIEDAAPEGGREIQDAWETGLDLLQSRVENKYKVDIEHDGEKIRVSAFTCNYCQGSRK